MTTADNTAVPFHPEGSPFEGYPFFVDSARARESWDKLPPEQQQDFLEAVPYIQKEYPSEELTVGMIGTILAVGG